MLEWTVRKIFGIKNPRSKGDQTGTETAPEEQASTRNFEQAEGRRVEPSLSDEVGLTARRSQNAQAEDPALAPLTAIPPHTSQTGRSAEHVGDKEPAKSPHFQFLKPGLWPTRSRLP